MTCSVNKGHSAFVQKGTIRIRKTRDAREFDNQVQLWIHSNRYKLQKIKDEINLAINSGVQLKIICYFCFNRSQLWTKDGRVKQLDTNNRIKPTLDGIAKAIGIDDRHFWAEEHEKVETDEDPHVMIAIGTHRPTGKKSLWIASGETEKPLTN